MHDQTTRKNHKPHAPQIITIAKDYSVWFSNLVSDSRNNWPLFTVLLAALYSNVTVYILWWLAPEKYLFDHDFPSHLACSLFTSCITSVGMVDGVGSELTRVWTRFKSKYRDKLHSWILAHFVLFDVVILNCMK